MPTFKINHGHPDREETVKAREFVNNGDFVDFLDKHGAVVFRIHASQVLTVQKQAGGSRGADVSEPS